MKKLIPECQKPLTDTVILKVGFGQRKSFSFNLIGQETLDSIKSFVPIKNNTKYPGLEKLIDLTGLAMSPFTFQMLKAVDAMVDEYFPGTLNKKGEIVYSKLLYETVKPRIGDIASGLFKLMKSLR